MKKRVLLKSLSLLLSSVLMTGVLTLKPKAAVLTDFSKDEIISAPIQSIQTLDAVYGVENGVNVAYTTVTGSASSKIPAMFNVVDLDNEKLLKTFELQDASSAWTHVVTKDGSVYIGTTGAKAKLFKYSPSENKVEDLGVPLEGDSTFYTLSTDGELVFGGGYSTGAIFSYDPANKKFKNYGKVDDGTAPGDDGKSENYIKSMVYHKGSIYAGTGTNNGRVWKINPATGEKFQLQIPKGLPENKGSEDKMGMVYHINVVRNYLFAFFNGPRTVMIYDLDKEQWLNTVIPEVRGMIGVSDEVNGHVYFSSRDTNMYRFNLDTLTLDPNPVRSFNTNLRNTAVIDLKDSEFGKNTMVSVNFNGSFYLFDFDNNKCGLTKSVVSSQPNNIQSIEKGADGNIYISGYMGSIGVKYNPLTGESTNFTLGQIEGMGSLGNKLYLGEYPTAQIFELDTTQTTPKPVKIGQIGEGQDRPFKITSGDGKVFIGTIPGYAELGGALTIYNPENKSFKTIRNIVPNQSIVGLAYKDGLIYGSTSIAGGLGIEASEKRAKLFVYDVNNDKVLKIQDLEVAENETLPMISGLEFGQDGLLWGTANGWVFALDKETLKVVKKKQLYPEITNYGRWRPTYIKFDNKGLMYTNPGEKLTAVDINSLDSKFIANTGIFTLDNEDNLYYSKGVYFHKVTPKALDFDINKEFTPITLNLEDKELNLFDEFKKQINLPINEEDVYFEVAGSAVNLKDNILSPVEKGEATITPYLSVNGEYKKLNGIKVTVKEAQKDPDTPKEEPKTPGNNNTGKDDTAGNTSTETTNNNEKLAKTGFSNNSIVPITLGVILISLGCFIALRKKYKTI